jgi:ABC-2 type transport system ATP-binding protein
MLKLDKVTKYLGDKKVLDEVSFELKPGEVVGLLGPNGAGKTTTMRALAGYFFPDEGQIKYEDKSIYEDFSQYKSVVGFMPESNPLYRELSVKESLDTALDFK